MRLRRALAVLLLATGAFLTATPSRSADPFVGYGSLRSPDGSFVLFYPQRLEPMAKEIEGNLESSAPVIARELGLDRIRTIRVYIAPDDDSFKYLHEGRIPDWGAAFSDLNSQVLGIHATLVMRSPRPLGIVVRHELSHLLLAQRVEGVHVPTWFMEGLAMRQAGEWDLSESWTFMNLAARRRLPYLPDLDGAFPNPRDEAALAYGMSFVAVDELFRERPDALSTLTSFIRDRGDFESAFATTFGRSTAEFAAALAVTVYQKYRLPGTIVNAAPYWVLFALLFVAVYVIKRVRTRRKVEEWERREERRRPTFFN
jgi:hypothetical protein